MGESVNVSVVVREGKGPRPHAPEQRRKSLSLQAASRRLHRREGVRGGDTA